MPLLYLHLSIAKDAADRLGHPTIDSQMGSYLGGSISPDAHFMSSVSRSDTHFFNLETTECESGVSSIFSNNPGLASESDIDVATKSFIAGYLCHLITDEIWTIDIYRPFFGDASPLGGDLEANTLDRLLQYETDRWERQDKEKLALIRGALCDWEPEVGIDFIEPQALRDWLNFVCATTAREVTQGDFRLFAQHFLISREKVSVEQLEPFLESIPAKLDWVIEYITPQRLEAFRQKAVDRSVTAIGEYLDEDS
jgi:hypothetical protein